MTTSDTGRFPLGDIRLQSGAVLPDAVLSWRTHGVLAPGRDNVVLYPTSYSAQHPDLEWLIGPDKILDPGRWFIVIPDMFGNGLSTSPSNNPGWPGLVTAWDNVHAQGRLLAGQWGIDRLHAVYGWSMGAQQAYHWAALYPDKVARAVVNCGSARTATHNRVFLKGLMAVLEAAPEHRGDGWFSAEPAAALRAFGRIYAGWGLSQDSTAPGCTRARSARPISTPSCVPTGRSVSPAARPRISTRSCGRGRRATSPGRALRRRSRPGARGDPGARAPDAGRDRSLLPGRRQRGRAAASAPCATDADPEHLGTPGREPVHEPGRCDLPKEGRALLVKVSRDAGFR